MNDQLTHLAEVDTPRPTLTLDAVERRARTLRRAHRTRTGMVTGAVAAAFVVGGVVVPQISDTGGEGSPSAVALAFGTSPARAADAAKDCGSGSAAWADRAGWAQDAEVTDAAYLLGDTTWPLTGLGVHETTLTCLPAVPVALLLDTDPMRGLTVWADVADPLGGAVDDVSDVQVRGTDGRLRDLGTAAFVTWVEDGTRWMANGSGMTVDELLADLDRLAFEEETLVQASVPEGFDVVPVTDSPTDLTVSMWWAQYGDTVQVEGQPEPPVDGGAELEVTTAYQEPAELLVSYDADGVQLADVAGARAVFAPWGDPATDVGGRLIWQTDGVTYRLSGRMELDRLVELARTVTPVDVTDPVVTGAPEIG